MGYRLSKIYTRTGDTGDTGPGDGSRLGKDTPRITCMGDLDELNSALGVLLAQGLDTDLSQLLVSIQHRLFDLGGELAIPGHHAIDDEQVRGLEQVLDRLNAELPPLREFILPGGHPSAAYCHLARAICRRAERQWVALSRRADLNPHALSYLNRLSDLLFVVARDLNRRSGDGDVLWTPNTP